MLDKSPGSTSQDTWDALLCDVDECGSRSWFDENRQLHRENGPAFIHYSGTRYWYNHGVLHREDGPAIIHADGTKSYYLNNRGISSRIFEIESQLLL